MAQRFEQKVYSRQEYWALEEQSLTKHEYYQGQVYQMSGGSPNHSLIAANLISVLSNALRDRPCRVYTSDLAIDIEARDLITYPDVSVVCGPLEYSKDNSNAVANPQLIVEVLSASTALYDQTTKFNLYKGLASFQEYLLVDSKRASVIYYRKLGANEWLQRVYSQLDEVVSLEELALDLSLKGIYSKIEFDPQPVSLHEP